MKRFKVILLLFLFSVALGKTAWPQSPEAVTRRDAFHLRRGNYWRYEGTTRWTEVGHPGVKEKKVVWKMEVVDTLSHDGLQAALVKGHPYDLIWYEEGRERGDYVFLVDAKGQCCFLTGEDVLTRWKQAKEGAVSLSELVKGAEIFLAGPLSEQVAVGKMIQDSPPADQWVVTGKKFFVPQDFPELAKRFTQVPVVYQIVLQTCPDKTSVDFIEGIGIVRFVYQHHGTVSEVDLHLIEYSGE